jgi:REP element-mobilizing transposase RayT
MNRGRRGDSMFIDTKDYRLSAELLKETAETWNARIGVYCLMPNHYHLLTKTPDANISRCMRHLNGVYTQRFSRTHHCDGQLFRGRYKSILVDADSYLLQLVRYIHRNPLRAGLTDRLGSYGWSSHKGYLSKAEKWDWLHKDYILSMLSRRREDWLRAYRQFVASEDDEQIIGIFERKKWPSFSGADRFVRWV